MIPPNIDSLLCGGTSPKESVKSRVTKAKHILLQLVENHLSVKLLRSCGLAEIKISYISRRLQGLVHVWAGNKKKPRNFEREFHISKNNESVLQKNIENQSSALLKMTLNQELEQNRLLTEYESQTLLIDKSKRTSAFGTKLVISYFGIC